MSIAVFKCSRRPAQKFLQLFQFALSKRAAEQFVFCLHNVCHCPLYGFFPSGVGRSQAPLSGQVLDRDREFTIQDPGFLEMMAASRLKRQGICRPLGWNWPESGTKGEGFLASAPGFSRIF